MAGGSGITQLANTIKRLGFQSIPQIEVAQVLSVGPDWLLQIKDSKIQLDTADLVFNASLLPHKEAILVHFSDGVQEIEMENKNPVKVDDFVFISEMSGGQKYAVIAKVGGGEPLAH